MSQHALPLTLGVEEEFLLLDAATGDLAPAAPQVLAAVGEEGVKSELMLYQIETVTGICADLDEVRAQITELRSITAAAAARYGCLLVASGVAPGALLGLDYLTDDARYRRLALRHAGIVAEAGTCACHVHVGVPSREAGLQVLVRLRPWLAALLALSANSPIAGNRVTTWASWRYRRWARWPSAMPPQHWHTTGDYDATVRSLILQGKALDERAVYFHARLSPRYPTIEVRLMDTCLSVEDTVLIVALVRAMTAAALEDIAYGRPAPRVPEYRILTALAAAARHGRQALPALPQRLLSAEPLASLLTELARRGTGAERQRALWESAGSFAEFANLLAEATLTPATRDIETGHAPG